MQHYIGLDLGQASQFTAWAVVERSSTYEAEPPYALRHLQRFALGTPFKQIVQDVCCLANQLATKDSFPSLVVDLTGVGRPVLDMIYRAAPKASITAACLTAGQQASTLEDGTRLVPKIELVSCLQVLLQSRRLRVARNLSAAKVLARELENFRMKPVLAAGDSLAWRENQHDDLVFAVGLASWLAEREPPWGPNAFTFGGASMLTELLQDVCPCDNPSDRWFESIRF
jgi:hypothetical protein